MNPLFVKSALPLVKYVHKNQLAVGTEAYQVRYRQKYILQTEVKFKFT